MKVNKAIQVHMLPTEDRSHIVKRESDSKIIFYNSLQSNEEFVHLRTQHIYHTSDERPKNGDWCINPKGLPDIFGFDYRAVYTREEVLKCRKIISTTDTKLNLGICEECKQELISALKSHVNIPIYLHTHDTLSIKSATYLKAIEAFCEADGLWKVLVEYEVDKYDERNQYQHIPSGKYWEDNPSIKSPKTLYTNAKHRIPKVNSNNEITIHQIKKTFTHDDITHALAYGYDARRSGLSHHEMLINYKEANNLK